MQIQQILREELRESTVIVIAHKQEAVQDANYVVRLDKGRVVVHGPAALVSIDEERSGGEDSEMAR